MRIRTRRAATSSRTRDAVSEVIANILIIGMTAVLFAGIFYFVANLKGPTEDSSIQMSSSLESDRDFAVGSRIWLNITHLGGRTIGAGVTDISIQVDGSAAIYDFSDGGLRQTWPVGESWSLVVQNDANTTLPGIVNLASAVFATISDTEKSTVIWAGHVFLKLNAFGPRIDGGVDPSPVPESAPFLLWARIVELEGQEIVSATVVSTDLGILTPVNLTFNFARDRWETPAPSGMPKGKYSLTVTAADIAGKTSTKTIYFTVGDITGAGPDLLVDSGFIIFSDESPIRGDEIVVTAVVFNLGGSASGANCTFYLNSIAPANILSYVNITTIAPGGGVDAKLNWKAQPGGLHTILISCATYPNPGADIDPGNNQAGRQISVLPRILLVDDDQEPDTSFASETIYLKSAMDATDFQYDVAVVGSGVGPDYDSGATPLQDYDVVVWTTGQRTSGTLIDTDVGKSILCGLDNGEDDVGHLTTFMCNGGRVWLVGEGILNEAGTSPWPSPVRAVSFLNAYFGFTPDPIVDTLAPAMLQSTGTPLWLSKPPVDFATTLRWSPDGTDRITSNLVPAAAHTTLRDKAIPADAYGVNFTGVGLGGAQFRSIFMSVGFATMRDSGDQAQTTYHYLLWLSGLPKKLGHDVAISAATVDPPAPRFQQDVRFNLTVRNNGGFDETNFEVLLTDIYQGVETQIATVTVPTIAQLGGEYKISQVWRPDRLGVHTLRAIADWNNKIVESNENNNEISKLIFSGQVVVGFNLLVVDDDANGGALPANSTRAIVDDIAALNLGRTRPFLQYDYYTVAPGSNGPTADVMLRYNAVIWNTGAQSTTVLTAADRSNLTRYLEQSPVGSHLALIAPRIYEEVAERPLNAVFLCQKTGVDFSAGSQQLVPGAPSSYSFWGTFNDGIAHGMRISLAGGYPAGQLRRYQPCAGGAGALHGETGADDYWNTTAGMRHFVLERHNVAFKQKGVFSAIDPAFISTAPTAPGAFSRSELLYQIMHWLGAPDELANARVTPPDLYVGNDYGKRVDLSNVQLSIGYVLKVRMRNTGNADATGMNIRFLDSASTIAVDNTDVDGGVVSADWTVTDGVTVVEVLWTPLFAGPRSLGVVVDPLGIVTERTKVDNVATQVSQVWFFHDDLEKGGKRWSHEAVITRINGENPIDFIPPGTTAFTDIPGSWDLARSSGMIVDGNVSHSAPNSFRLQEVPAPAVDVYLVFQNTNPLNSQSYDGVNDKWFHAQKAGNTFVGLMRPKDRVGIIQFVGGGGIVDPRISQQMIQATTANKAALNTSINSIGFLGGASQPQVDATWVGACNLLINQLGNPANTWPTNRTKAIVIVTGGPSQSDEDNPAASCGSGLPDPGSGACCGAGGASAAWAGTGAGSGVRQVPFPVFVVNVHNGDAVEMKGVANNSCGGFYIQDPSAANIDSVYRSIAILLTGGSSSFAPGDMAIPTGACSSGPLRHRWLTTPPILLDPSAERATVSLWHKFSMISGQNGVVAQIGMPLTAAGANDAPGVFNCPAWHVGPCGDGAGFSRENDVVHWEYLRPAKGPYNGNLNINATVQWPGGVRDDDNNTMLFAWTGVSTKGTFGWEQSEFDIAKYIGRTVRLNFSFYQFGGGSGKGWWVDDVVLKISRKDASEVTGGRDQWKLRCSADSNIGGPIAGRSTCAWANQDYDPAYGGTGFGYWAAGRGLDNSLISTPIDLTRARYATIAFDTVYNVNSKAGNPPDSMRVEISRDAGVNWQPVNLGVRLDAGVSGGGGTPVWVASSSLARLESNISGWAGSVINLRFRSVTTTEPGYVHCATGAACPPPTTPGRGGFWVDNIRISGTSSGGLYPDSGSDGPRELRTSDRHWSPDTTGPPREYLSSSIGLESVLAGRSGSSGMNSPADISAQGSYSLVGVSGVSGMAMPVGGITWTASGSSTGRPPRRRMKEQ